MTVPFEVQEAGGTAAAGVRLRSRNAANSHERMPTTSVYGALLVGAELLIGEVLLREVLADALQPLDEGGRERRADLAVHQHQQLAVAVEAAAVVVVDHVLAEVGHHRPVRPPAKALRDLQPVAVERPQFDDAEAVELDQQAHALGLGDRIGAGDLLEGPLAQRADREQQQLAVGDDGALLLERQLMAQRLRVGDLAGELGEIHLQHAQDLVDAGQRHVGLREHPLDARLRHAELVGELRIGQVRRLQLLLQRGDQVLGGAHGPAVWQSGPAARTSSTARGRKTALDGRRPDSRGRTRLR